MFKDKRNIEVENIEFRGVTLNKPHHWVYGSLDKRHDGTYWINTATEKNATHSVIKDTIGQYICMQDMNKKKLYSNDIIIVHDNCCWHSKDNKRNIGIIKFAYGSYTSIGTFCKYNIYCWLYKVEKIGNHYDNKNLLKLVYRKNK